MSIRRQAFERSTCLCHIQRGSEKRYTQCDEDLVPLALRACPRGRARLRRHPSRPSIDTPPRPVPAAVTAKASGRSRPRARPLTEAFPQARLRGLYIIVDPAACLGRNPLEIARQAIGGGARLLQLRDKVSEKGVQFPLAQALASLSRETGVPFIVNDHADLALAVGADGVHVGQKDLPVAMVRRVLGPELIVGASTNNPDEARQAEADGAHYVSVGRLFETGSKQDTRPATTDTIREVKASVSVPVCAIGGIKEANIAEVIAAGADMVAAISAVCASPDPREAARKLAEHFRPS
jgi:thiamine-phosphate pyrophosphorylase